MTSVAERKVAIHWTVQEAWLVRISRRRTRKMYVPDYLDSFEAYDREREEALAEMPICDCCKEPIQTRKAFYYNDQWFCMDRECEEELMKLVWEDIKKDYLETIGD